MNRRNTFDAWVEYLPTGRLLIATGPFTEPVKCRNASVPLFMLFRWRKNDYRRFLFDELNISLAGCFIQDRAGNRVEIRNKMRPQEGPLNAKAHAQTEPEKL